jgi:GntR family transcriptional regulator of arabinose operon
MIATNKQLKYQQAYDQLIKMLKNYEIGDKLPSERKLAQELEYTVFTVRNALDHMEENGIITRKHGSGTFLRSKTNTKDKKITAFLLPPNSGAYGLKIIEALSKEARRQNFDARTVWIQDFKEDAIKQVNELKDSGVQSVILPWISADETANLPQFLKESPIPVTTSVYIQEFKDSYFELPQIIGLDIVQTMEELVDYFILLEKKHIAILEPNIAGDTLLQNRFNATTRALAKHDIKLIYGVIDESTDSADLIAKQWKQYAGDLGVICYDDTMALRLLTAMHKINMSAPSDYAIIGFNNIEQCLYSDPKLTTVSQDFKHLAESMLKHSEGTINKQVVQSMTVNKHNLIIRETCGGKKKINDEFIDKAQKQGINICYDLDNWI